MDQNINDSAITLKNATLIVIGHGASDVAEGARVTLGHIETIRDKKLFADVRAGFMLGEPSIDNVFDGVETDTIVIVPNLACDGYFAGTILPKRLGLDGTGTQMKDGKKVILTSAVGEDPTVIDIAASQAKQIIDDHNLTADTTSLFIVGHGSGKNNESERRTVEVANGLKKNELAAEVKVAFLEHEPNVEDWHEDTTKENVIVIPYLMARGLHGGADIPELLNLTTDQSKLLEEQNHAGPFDLQGRKLWYCRAVGESPTIADIIVKRAEEALEN